MDYTKATAVDVPEIVSMLRELRRMTAETGTITTRAQGIILRSIPPTVLILVADELAKPVGLAETLSQDAR